jgi:hypothetical protein
MILSPFQPMGNSFSLTTNGVTLTNTSTPIILVGAGNLNLPSNQPTMARFLNTGASTIWLNFSIPVYAAGGATVAAGTAAVPVAGTTTLGTTANSFWLAPNIEEVLTIPVGPANLTGVANTPLGFWLNNMSVGVSQSFLMQLGEGT